MRMEQDLEGPAHIRDHHSQQRNPARHKGAYDCALVLGGGGVKCLAHVGVLETLERMGLKPDLIVGSSIGSVMGGVYAYRNDAAFLRAFALRFAGNPMLKKLERGFSAGPARLMSRLASFCLLSLGFAHSFWTRGLLSAARVKRAYRHVIGENVLSSRIFLLEDTVIPFAALATDLSTSDAIIMTTGDMPDALYASSALPGICKPFQLSGMQLVDGGIVSVIPVMAAHLLGAGKIIAVNTEPAIRRTRFANALGFLDVASSIRGMRWHTLETALADLVITPDSTERYEFYQFSKAEACIDAGRKALTDRRDNIETLITSPPNQAKIAKRIYLERFYPHRII